MRSVTTDAEGNEVNTTVGTNGITVQFSRKLGRENYGNEECGLFLQLDVNAEDDASEIEARIAGTLAFAKTIVYGQLGIESTTDENGVVRDVVQPEKAKASYPKKGAAAKPAAASNGAAPDKDALWASLTDALGNVGADGRIPGFYDNRAKKASGDYSSKSPDFKHIESGAGLWLDKAPEIVKLAVNG